MFDSTTSFAHLRQTILTTRVSLVVCAAVIIALLAVTAALAPRAGAAGALAPDAMLWHPCVPTQTMTHENRVHVKCAAPAPGGVYYFAVSTSNAARASQMLSLASTAQVAGRPLQVLYYTETSVNPEGCLTDNCRLMRALAME